MSQIKSEQEWLRTIGILVVAFICLAVGLHLAQNAVVPFVLAMLISVTASPLIDWQTRGGFMPHAVAVFTTLTVVLSTVALVTALLAYALREAGNTARDQWDPSVKQLTTLAIEWGIVKADQVLGEGPEFPQPPTDDTAAEERVNPEQPPNSQAVSEAVAANAVRVVSDYFEKARNQFLVDNADIVPPLMTQAVLTAIFVGFLLAGYRPSSQPTNGIQSEIVSGVRRYVSTKFFVSALTGMLVWAVMTMIGFRYAPLFGVLAFVLNFIPSLGSIVCTFLPLPLAIAEYDSWGPVIAVIALPGALQMVIGNILEPKIMGDGLDLHPATILLSLAFWGILWGPVGMLLAAPLAASARIILGRIDTTRPFAELMAGRVSDTLVLR